MSLKRGSALLRQVSRTRPDAVIAATRKMSSHDDVYDEHAEHVKSRQMWKNISLACMATCVVLGGIQYKIHMAHANHTPHERVEYEYRSVMNKPFPWGDGKTNLFK
eukprot:CAMPEP_0114558202 /NCGR_PEP_ID=MMETSP0114-20121206/10246_1 /TAXON_ID=31324 /ORGANISM="Goniomonas sp, Strain m" /LENGTH=105 /DNA_ID=CAMNT_0001743557 /DNA_START=102 /DNA_END=419 /DNA_ORIENTATION=-